MHTLRELTHALLVQAIELQSCSRRWLLGPGAYFVHCVQGMTEDSVWKDPLTGHQLNTCVLGKLAEKGGETQDYAPTESDITAQIVQHMRQKLAAQ